MPAPEVSFEELADIIGALRARASFKQAMANSRRGTAQVLLRTAGPHHTPCSTFDGAGCEHPAHAEQVAARLEAEATRLQALANRLEAKP